MTVQATALEGNKGQTIAFERGETSCREMDLTKAKLAKSVREVQRLQEFKGGEAEKKLQRKQSLETDFEGPGWKESSRKTQPPHAFHSADEGRSLVTLHVGA